MSASLLDQGLEMMLFGMGTVFVFLACLVLVTTLMSALVQRLDPPSSAPAAAPATTPVSEDKNLVAAITAAIHQYRSRHK